MGEGLGEYDMDIIEHLSQNEAWMEKFCRDCSTMKHCPCEWNPFFDVGCIRDADLRDLEDAAENFEKLAEEKVA